MMLLKVDKARQVYPFCSLMVDKDGFPTCNGVVVAISVFSSIYKEHVQLTLNYF